MKISLLPIAALLLLSACSEPKIKLRAPEKSITENQVIQDTLVKDSMRIMAKELAK